MTTTPRPLQQCVLNRLWRKRNSEPWRRCVEPDIKRFMHYFIGVSAVAHRNRKRSWRLLGLMLLAAGPAHADFGEGSNEDFVKRVQTAQAGEYQQVLEEFEEYLRGHPQDSIAAVERCRFIDAFAYVEDLPIETAASDSEACRQAVESGPLRESAAVKLYLAEQSWDDEGLAKAESLLAESASWTSRQRAALHSRLARGYGSDDPVKAGQHALAAVELDPTSDQRLVAAEYLVRVDAPSRAEAVIRAMPEPEWKKSWVLQKAVTLLIDAGKAGAALRLVRAHPETDLSVGTRIRLANTLRDAGAADDARELMASLDLASVKSRWGHEAERQLFEYQLDHGTRDQATAAYRALRDRGRTADPWGRLRLSLSLRYPTSAWQVEDGLGLGAFAVMLGVMVLLPLGIVAPLHYWSLYRVSRGVTFDSAQVGGGWGLSHLWYALGAVLCAQALAFYLWCYPAFETLVSLGSNGAVAKSGMPDAEQLGRAFFAGQTLAAVLLLPLLRGVRFGELLRGGWSVKRSLGIGLITLIAFLILVSNLKKSFGGTVAPPGIVLGGDTIRAMQGLFSGYGLGGLLLVSAIIAPVLEEFVFRGVFLRAGSRYLPVGVAAIAQAIVFAAWHDQPGSFLPLVAFALVAAYLARRSGGLLAPSVFHAGNNFMASLAVMGMTRSIQAMP